MKVFFNNLFKRNCINNYNFNYDFKSINFPQKKLNHIIVFTGGTYPEPKFCKYFFRNFQKPDYIIAADSGLELLDLFNNFYKNDLFLPNCILGDMDSLKNKSLLKKYKNLPECQIEKFDPYKDFTDTELALILASKVKNQNTIVTLIGGSGGRIDHLLSVFNLFSTNIRPDFWLTSDQILCFVEKNKKISLLTNKKDSPISVLLPMNKNPILVNNKISKLIHSSGLEWESHLFRNEFVPSLSNILKVENFLKKVPATIHTEIDLIIAFDFNTKINLLN